VARVSESNALDVKVPKVALDKTNPPPVGIGVVSTKSAQVVVKLGAWLKSREPAVLVTEVTFLVSKTVPLEAFCGVPLKDAPPLIRPACAVASPSIIAATAAKPKNTNLIIFNPSPNFGSSSIQISTLSPGAMTRLKTALSNVQAEHCNRHLYNDDIMTTIKTKNSIFREIYATFHGEPNQVL
jgi:hypothetical protein